jgi:hypothetical protein
VSLVEKATLEYMSEDVQRAEFYEYLCKNGQAATGLVAEVKKIISEHNLSVSQAKGFLDYMKLVIEDCTTLH